MSEDANDIINMDNPITESEQVHSQEPEQQAPSFEIPDKFQGKSQEDIIKDYMNLEKDHSRLGNELGENRKLVDQVLQAELSRKPTVTEPEPELDWDYEPDKAAKELVSQEVGQVNNKVDQLEQKLALKDFKSDFPSFEKDSASPEFLEWVKGSEYRMNLYNKNTNGIDFTAARELMSGYSDYKSIHDSTQDNQEQEQQRQQDLKAASMEKGASAGTSRKKMWSRAYIRELRLNDPSKYKSFEDEIKAAYREDRIIK